MLHAKYRILSFLFLACALNAGKLGAQSPCASSLMIARCESDVNCRSARNKMEQQYRAYITEAESKHVLDPLTVPVVFHIVHAPGEVPGQGANLSDQEVQAGLDFINNILAGTLSCPGHETSAPSGIRLCLAQRDRYGVASTGILRYDSPLSFFDLCTEDAALKTLPRPTNDPYPNTDYLNIYLVSEICASCLPYDCAVAGVSAYPQTHGTLHDGLVLEARTWNPANCFNHVTPIHELGHYFNLLHTFDGGCQNDDCLGQGDRVCDTPPDNSVNIYPHNPCTTGQHENSCATDVNLSDPNNPWATDQPDPDDNYMDYAPNACAQRFTPGQALRMRAALEGPRSSLLQSRGCEPVCETPVLAAFSGPDTAQVGVGVLYINQSQGGSIYSWEVEGSMVQSADLQHTFNAPGQYTITLTVSNGIEGCAMQAEQTVIVLCALQASLSAANTYTEPGESAVFVNTSPDQAGVNFTWYVDGVAAGSGDTLSIAPDQEGNHHILIEACDAHCCTRSSSALLQTGTCESPRGHENWFFGVDSLWLSFANGYPEILPERTALFSAEPSTIVSDTAGNLLFYSDGRNIYNHLHQIIPNGANIQGGRSSTHCLALRQPGYKTQYFLFYPQQFDDFFIEQDTATKLHYAIIDMEGNGGLGQVLDRDILLLQRTTEKVAAARHCNGVDWWIIGHEAASNRFFCWLFDKDGLHPPIISAVGRPNSGFDASKAGALKVSPDLRKLAMSTANDFSVSLAYYSGFSELFDFDNATGVVGNVLLLQDSIREPYGLAFSADNSKLYAFNLSPGRLYQYDLSNPDPDSILASRTLIFGPNSGFPITYAGGMLQLGPDDRIYVCNYGLNSLGVIQYPNKKGLACGFEPIGFDMGDVGGFLGLPTFPADAFHPGKPYLQGASLIDSCASAAPAPFFVTGNCSYQEYLWQIRGNSRIVAEQGDTVWVVPGAAGWDTLIVQKMTACRILYDTLVFQVIGCPQPCDETQLEASLSAANTYTEPGESAVFVNTSPDQAGVNFTWYVDGVAVGSDDTLSIAPDQEGNHHVLIETCDAHCCTRSPSALLQVGTCESPRVHENWFFGLDSIWLSFGNGYPQLLPERTALLGIEASSIVSDAAGSLLFYSDSYHVYNRQHEIMPNGANIQGGPSSTQCLALRQPGYRDRYFLFYPQPFSSVLIERDTTTKLHYAIIDMTGNGGLGQVLDRDILLLQRTTEKVAAARHCNGVDWWIIGHEAASNRFFCWLFDKDGIHSPTISSVGRPNSGVKSSKAGAMKVSPNLRKLAMNNGQDSAPSQPNNGFLELFDFDNATGIVSNTLLLQDSIRDPVGLAFSADNSKLYGFNSPGRLYQYDLSNPNPDSILASRTLIFGPNSGFPIIYVGGALQLGPDDRIYVCNYGLNSLGVIQYPNKKGLACGFEPIGFDMGDVGGFLGLPNFPADAFHPGKPYLQGASLIDSCASAAPVPFYVTGNCSYQEYLWEIRGNSRIVAEQGDTVWIVPGAAGWDTLIVQKMTACRILYDTLVFQVIGCPQPCGGAQFAWTEVDSMVCVGERAYGRFASNALDIVLQREGDAWSMPVEGGAFDFPATTTDACYRLQLNYGASCDTSIRICVQVSPAQQFQWLELDSVVCYGEHAMVSFATTASQVELINEFSPGLRTNPMSSISIGPVLGDSCYVLRLSTPALGCDTLIRFCVRTQIPLDTTYATATSCDPTEVGTTLATLSTLQGCDSIVITTTTLLPSDTTMLEEFVCHPNQAGVQTLVLSNQFGCDSTVMLNRIFDSALIDTTYLSAVSCDPTQVGTMMATLSTLQGCDSIVITTTTLLPSDTTMLEELVCHPNQAGVQTFVLSNQFGCDSTVMLSRIFDSALIDTTYLSAASCDPTQVGMALTTLSTLEGCDSIVITTTTLLPSDTTMLEEFVCHPNQAGVQTFVLSNQFGCDSTVMLSRIFDSALIDTTYLSAASCDAAQIGTTLATLSTLQGCDSIVITTTTLLPSDTTMLEEFVCNPNQAGVQTLVLSNQFGCDSTVMLSRIFDSALIDTTYLSAMSCNPAQVGTMMATLSTLQGCDSIVITTTTLLPSDTVMLEEFVCHPDQAGVQIFVLNNQFGCDSTVLISRIFDSDQELIQFISADTLVLPGQPVTLSVELSRAAQVRWSPDTFLDCPSCLSVLAHPEYTILYTLTATDSAGCTAIAYTQVQVDRRRAIYAPNAFSPNADGHNDTFILYGLPDRVEIRVLQVFDRWGELVYEARSLTPGDELRGWDGRIKEQLAPPAVYVYQAEVEWSDGRREWIKGEFVLMR